MHQQDVVLLRLQFDYWRDLRNVCAHYKEYRFIKAHTLTLYSFIRSLSFFNVGLEVKDFIWEIAMAFSASNRSD